MTGTLTDRVELRFVGPHGQSPDPRLVRPGQVLRLLTRQLYVSPGTAAGRPVPDVAVGQPVPLDGGRRRFRITLRSDVCWDAQQARPLTAADFIRGIKRIAHPNAGLIRPYFETVLAGMREYCAAYDATFAGRLAHAPDYAQFQARHEISGLRAESATSLLVTLTEPAGDLVDLLATGYAAAAPREYDYYVPDSRDLYRNSPSAGPYRVRRTSAFGEDLVLEPNPRWDPATDPVRSRPADLIRIDALGDAAPAADASDGVGWRLGTVGGEPGGGELPGRGLCPYLLFRPQVGAAARQAVAAAVDRGPLTRAVSNAGGLGARPQYTVFGLGGAEVDTGTAARTARADPGQVRLTVATPGGRGYTFVLHQLVAAGIRCAPADPADADLLVCEWTPAWAGNHGRDLIHRLWQPAGAGPSARVAELAAAALRRDDSFEQRHWAAVDVQIAREGDVLPLVSAVLPRAVAEAVAPGAGRFAGRVR